MKETESKKKTPVKKTTKTSKPVVKKAETKAKKSKMTFNLNRDTLGVIATIVVVVAVAAFSFFLAFSLRKDVGTSIPSDYSRYIATDFVIGFPGGWQISSGSAGGFSAAQVDPVTGESEGSISVTTLSMGDIMTDGFNGYGEDACAEVLAYLSGQQTEVTGSDFIRSESKSLDINGSEACQIDTAENGPVTGEGEAEIAEVNTRYLIVEKDGKEESYVVVGFWGDEEEIEDDISVSLRTFEVIETDDDSEEEASDESAEG